MTENQEIQKTKKNRGWLIALIVVLAAILLLAAILMGAILIYGNGKLDQITFTNGIRSGEGEVDGKARTVALQDAEAEDAKKTLQKQEIKPASVPVQSREGITNILILITDDTDSGFSEESYVDSLFLVSVNETGGGMKFITLNGNSGVTVLEGSRAGQVDRLFNTYRYGGEDLLMKQAEDAYRVKISHFLRINYATLISLVNGIGGAELELDQKAAEAMKESCGYSGPAGKQTLTGTEAIAYTLSGEWNDYLGKKQKQAELAAAALNSLTKAPVNQWNGIFNEVLSQLRTNLAKGQITRIVLSLPTVLSGPMGQMDLPVKGTYGWTEGAENRTVFSPDYEENAKQLQEYIYGNVG